MTKSIVSVGFEIPAGDATYASFESRVSLLDWDIVLFRPDIGSFIDFRSSFQGKPSLDEHSSFRLKELCEHWRREIKQAIEAGKTVFIFLSELQEVYIDTGKREYSGTGRNQKTTTIVGLYSNYKSIPIELLPIKSKGSGIKLAPNGSEIISQYWSEFSNISEYEIVISSESIKPILITKSGGKNVAALVRSEISTGAMVLLPNIDFENEEFFEEKNSEIIISLIGERFSVKIISSIVALDKVIQSSEDASPEPTWVKNNDFLLNSEKTLTSELNKAQERLKRAKIAVENVENKLKEEGRLRGLLYEKGKALEHSILNALLHMGFEVSQYRDRNSEFDVVFICEDGRLLGEAEGKDNKAINVDKLRQLSMNIHEDLSREDVLIPAKGVLFGNAYRLQSPNERAIQFTEKCINAAKSSSTALIATSELFKAVQYILESNDKAFTSACRKAILEGVGLVEMPMPPPPQSLWRVGKFSTVTRLGAQSAGLAVAPQDAAAS